MTSPRPPTETERAIQAVWKLESAKLIASLTRIVRDVGLAEELAQDALVAALAQWPTEGVPRNPAAWLMSATKNRAINLLRRGKMLERKHAELAYEADAEQEEVLANLEAKLDEQLGDDLLRLMFTACHPLLSSEGRIALTLRLLGGLTTEEIARAFLTSEPTIAQRIVRAKRTLAEAQVPFEVPRGPELSQRLASVLEVIYLIFNEGYSATAGEDLLRPALCEEALRLGRILAELAADEAEVHGLLALMEINASRAAARTLASGEPVLLLEQDRSSWDRTLIRQGLTALARAEALGGARGPYLLQAEITACHARAATPEETDWRRIADLYGELSALVRSPVVELNRAVAVSMADGPAAGLALVDALSAASSLRNYHFLPSARGELLSKLGRFSEAQAEFERAAQLTRNARQRERLLLRAEGCAQAAGKKS
ncbi:MAG TPA: RNA polymerase sigma factor [Polyangiaceae bacterium]|nr:RNA polymerase sigma factor [Polyangiaceae bacterium]